MYYKPNYFAPHEVFTPSTIERYTMINGLLAKSIWLLMDDRVLWTLDQLREQFGPVILNDYYWGGHNHWRGFRPIQDLNEPGVPEAVKKNRGSQHCFGRAADCVFKNTTVEEVRNDIKQYPYKDRYKYIKAVEDKVPWLHFDVRAIIGGPHFF